MGETVATGGAATGIVLEILIVRMGACPVVTATPPAAVAVGIALTVTVTAKIWLSGVCY